ncbi:MAG: 4-alpha-glucanotransferase [Parachlamydiales bacterium]|nr:4-alpha-glucanotransferase [Parachlamydiales bacterium]
MKTDAHWERIGKRPHHGICVPLFSIHSKKSSGIGEFLDLIPLIDWCKEVGFDVIQLLPINDTGRDPSPYNPLSSCALNPIYLSLWELGIECPKANTRAEVLQLKIEKLLSISSPPPESFIEQHPWLLHYAEFRALKEQFNGVAWQDFPKEAKPDPKLVEFFIFVQFHAFRQMEMVKAHAEKQGVKIKGDVPILISPDSADVWSETHLFNLKIGAGAPPDTFHAQGQSWGFPLLDWAEMRKRHFDWWKMRLRTIEHLYHIYRIDHVVGFFRIWGIPRGKKAIEGSFYPPDQRLWMDQGTEILEMMIDASPLLPMAEDLGTIPKEVYPILKRLGICGTKVMRWQKEAGHYIPLDHYEPISLTTLGTHDLPPVEVWWKKTPEEAAPFASLLHLTYHPILREKERMAILRASHKTTSLFHINPLQEYLALFPELANHGEEQINYPGTLSATNWTYKFRPSVEEMIAHEDLKRRIREVLTF